MSDADGKVGVFCHGEFLALNPGKAWPADNPTHFPVVASILVGDRVVRVEYRDADAAEAALGQAQRGDAVAVPVFAQSPKNAPGTVFWRGR